MPIIKLAIVFFLIIYLQRIKLQMGYAILIGSLILGFSFGMDPVSILRSAFEACISADTLELSGIVVLILILSYILEEKKQLQKILDSLQALVKNVKTIIVMMPAMVGLLPMPGGALFSAPMVKVAAEKYELDPVQNTLINYWFRHVWEYSWPLYPGIIFASKLSGINLYKLSLAQLPLSLVMLLSGIFFYIMPLRQRQDCGNEDTGGNGEKALLSRISDFLVNIIPIILIIIMALALRINFLLTICAAIAATLFMVKVKLNEIPKLLVNGVQLNMVILVVAVMIFNAILKQSGSVEITTNFLKAHNFPVMLIFALLPLLTGIMTGLSIGFIGVAFPIVFSLLGSQGYTIQNVILAFGMGYLGVLLSPVHLCLVMTKDYFGAPLGQVYKKMILPLVPVVVLMVILYFVY